MTNFKAQGHSVEDHGGVASFRVLCEGRGLSSLRRAAYLGVFRMCENSRDRSPVVSFREAAPAITLESGSAAMAWCGGDRETRSLLAVAQDTGDVQVRAAFFMDFCIFPDNHVYMSMIQHLIASPSSRNGSRIERRRLMGLFVLD
jgi:hypothetical protein